MTSLREELLADLSPVGRPGCQSAQDDTSLIVSGLIDSVGLFQMLLWIEEKVGSASTPPWWTGVAIGTAWARSSAISSSAVDEGPVDGRHRDHPVPSRIENEVASSSASESRDLAESRRYLEWKYEQNPYIRDPILYLARANGRLVGMRGLSGARWEAGQGNAPALMPYPDDHVVVEDQRGSGVATLLMRALLDDASARGIDYLCNLSAGLVTALASLAAGWKKVIAMEPVAVSHSPGTIGRLSRKLILQSEQRRGSPAAGVGTVIADACTARPRRPGSGASRRTITVEPAPRSRRWGPRSSGWGTMEYDTNAARRTRLALPPPVARIPLPVSRLRVLTGTWWCGATARRPRFRCARTSSTGKRRTTRSRTCSTA